MSTQTADAGDMSWIRANRIIGEPILNQGSLAIMALLTSLGILVPAAHWQLLHQARTGLEEIGGIIARTPTPGRLSWHKGAASEVLERISSSLPHRDLGWVNRQEFETLLQRLPKNPGARITSGPSNPR